MRNVGPCPSGSSDTAGHAQTAPSRFRRMFCVGELCISSPPSRRPWIRRPLASRAPLPSPTAASVSDSTSILCAGSVHRLRPGNSSSPTALLRSCSLSLLCHRQVSRHHRSQSRPQIRRPGLSRRPPRRQLHAPCAALAIGGVAAMLRRARAEAAEGAARTGVASCLSTSVTCTGLETSFLRPCRVCSTVPAASAPRDWVSARPRGHFPRSRRRHPRPRRHPGHRHHFQHLPRLNRLLLHAGNAQQWHGDVVLLSTGLRRRAPLYQFGILGTGMIPLAAEARRPFATRFWSTRAWLVAKIQKTMLPRWQAEQSELATTRQSTAPHLCSCHHPHQPAHPVLLRTLGHPRCHPH